MVCALVWCLLQHKQRLPTALMTHRQGSLRVGDINFAFRWRLHPETAAFSPTVTEKGKLRDSGPPFPKRAAILLCPCSKTRLDGKTLLVASKFCLKSP